MKNRIIKGYLFAVLSAVIYGCMPLMAKHIYAEGVNPFSLVFLRNFFSIAPLALLAFRETKSLRIPIQKLPSISLIAILGCSFTPVLLFSSYQFIPSGTATVFHFVYPAIVMIIDILFLRKKAQLHNIFSVLLCVFGICLFYTPQQALNLTGSALALASGLTFATYVVLLSHFEKGNISNFLFTFYVTLISSVFLFAFCLTTNTLTLPHTAAGWGLCILFSLAVATGAVVLFQQSAFLIGGERVSILSTLEPITSIVIGVIFFSEPLGIRILIGTVLVISASVLTALYDMGSKKA